MKFLDCLLLLCLTVLLVLDYSNTVVGENSEDVAKLIKLKHGKLLKQSFSRFHASSRDATWVKKSRTSSRDSGIHDVTSHLVSGRNADDWFANVTCDLCEFAIKEVQSLVRSGKAREEIVKEAIQICILFKVEDERVCNMVAHQFKDQALYVFTNLVLDPREACGVILGDECATPHFPGQSWNITLPDIPKPTPKPPTPPKPEALKLRFLHLTDIHIDFLYREGGVVECGEPVCCRVNDNVSATASHPSSNSKSSGKYGDYEHCDAPISLVDNLFKHLFTIKDEFDYIIFTGDIPAHDVWNQSQSDQIEHILTLDKMFSKYLPNKPVYSCIGNHESSPVNSFMPPGIPGHTMDWLYGTLAAVWGKWLPQSALDTVLQCGGYSTSPYPGFRIISINNNYCNKGSWWLLLNSTDPCGVLEWLVQELQSAEDKGEKVHILMHIPPGADTCLKWWSFNFYKIVNRYENTIVNQFYGHTHHDAFQMFYDDVNFQRPVGVGLIAPSVTPFSFLNPLYRIYTMDGNYSGSSWAVLDYQGFYLNLTKANEHDDPVWDLEYSPKKAYNMTSLYAADWEDLIQRMEKDDDLFNKFYRINQALNPRKTCQGSCKSGLLCELKEGRSFDPDLCKIHKIW